MPIWAGTSHEAKNELALSISQKGTPLHLSTPLTIPWHSNHDGTVWLVCFPQPPVTQF